MTTTPTCCCSSCLPSPAGRRRPVGGVGGRPTPARRRPALDHRPARRHDRVRRAGPHRLGGSRRAVAAGQGPDRWRGRAARTRHDAVDRGRAADTLASPRATRGLRSAGRGARRGWCDVAEKVGPVQLDPDRQRGHEGDVDRARRGRRLPAQRPDEGVGLRRPGRWSRPQPGCTSASSTARSSSSTSRSRLTEQLLICHPSLTDALVAASASAPI